MRSAQGRAGRWIERAGVVVENTAALALLFITALTFLSVLLRYGLNSPIPDQYDISRLMLGPIVAWGLALCFWRRNHIDVDLLTVRLPPRAAATVAALMQLIAIAFLAVLAWKLVGRVEAVARSGERTFDLGLPVWPWYAMTAAGFVVTIIMAALRIAADLRGVPIADDAARRIGVE